MVTRVTPLTTTRPVLEQTGETGQEMRSWAQLITDRALIIGTGSPEGVVEAPQGSDYMDDAGTAGNIRYSKRDNDQAGDKTLGWILN